MKSIKLTFNSIDDHQGRRHICSSSILHGAAKKWYLKRDFDEQDEVLSCGMGFEAACAEFECKLWRNPRERGPERFSILWRERESFYLLRRGFRSGESRETMCGVRDQLIEGGDWTGECRSGDRGRGRGVRSGSLGVLGLSFMVFSFLVFFFFI